MQILAGPLSVKAYKLGLDLAKALPASPESTKLELQASELADGISQLEEGLRVHLGAPYQPPIKP